MQNKYNGLVSVIIPTHNRRETIFQSVASVLNQTYTNLECIVIDDASTDETEEIISQINDQRLKYIRLQESMGAACARNRGIEEAKGELVAFNDSDDCWEVNKLERQLSYMDEAVGMVYCKYNVFREKELLYTMPADVIPREKKEGNIFYSLIESSKIGTPTMLIKKECLQDVGGFNEEYLALEDYELALRIAKKYYISFVDEALVRVYVSKNSVNMSESNKRDALFNILCLYKDEPIEKMYPLYINLFDRINENKQIYEKYTQELFNRCQKNIISFLYNELKTKNLHKYRYMVLMNFEKILDDKEKVCKLQELMEGKNIAIYGAGVIGEIIKKRLEEVGISVYCFIDENQKDKKKFLTYSVEDIPKKIDLIIASIHPILYDSEKIRKYTTAQIIGADKFLEKYIT